MTVLTSETLSTISRFKEVTVGPGGSSGRQRGPPIIPDCDSRVPTCRTKVNKSAKELCAACGLQCSSETSIWSPAIHVEAGAADKDAFFKDACVCTP